MSGEFYHVFHRHTLHPASSLSMRLGLLAADAARRNGTETSRSLIDFYPHTSYVESALYTGASIESV